MARHHHSPHLVQRTLAITVFVNALEPLPVNPRSYHTFCALYGNAQPVVHSSDYLRGNNVCWTAFLSLSSPLENWAEGITDVAYLTS